MIQVAFKAPSRSGDYTQCDVDQRRSSALTKVTFEQLLLPFDLTEYPNPPQSFLVGEGG